MGLPPIEHHDALELDVSFDEGVSFVLTEAEIAHDLDLVLEKEQVERSCLISLSVVTDSHMQELNRDWRDIDAPTDVLSLECESPHDPDLAPGEPCELGDIVLAPAYIKQQAEHFGTSFADETRLLLVHGLLHLLGYDHLEDEEAELMEAKEEEYLGLLSTDEAVRSVRLTRHRAGVDE